MLVRAVARPWPADEIAFNFGRDDLFQREQLATVGDYAARLAGAVAPLNGARRFLGQLMLRPENQVFGTELRQGEIQQELEYAGWH